MMHFSNIKTAEKKPSSAKKSQDSNIIEIIKQATLNHIYPEPSMKTNTQNTIQTSPINNDKNAIVSYL